MVANRDYKRIEIIYQDASEIDAKLEVYKEFGWELAFFTDDNPQPNGDSFKIIAFLKHIISNE